MVVSGKMGLEILRKLSVMVMYLEQQARRNHNMKMSDRSCRDKSSDSWEQSSQNKIAFVEKLGAERTLGMSAVIRCRIFWSSLSFS